MNGSVTSRQRWIYPILILVGFLPPTSAPGQTPDRRHVFQPGIVLNTGARHAYCDVLAFTADGTELLAAGDDKVVRKWTMGATGFRHSRSRNLRWPVYREQRGGIFAMAQSSDGKLLAIAGFGLKTGMVAVLDRESGAMVHVLDNPPSPHVNWAIAFSPGKRYVVFGNEFGEIYRWDTTGQAKTVSLFPGSSSKTMNRVRLIAFLDKTRFITVAQDGKILERNVTRLNDTPRSRGKFQLPSLYGVAISPDSRWLAAFGENVTGSKEVKTQRVELFDLTASKFHKFLDIQKSKTLDQFPNSLAFDANSERLAVGVRGHPRSTSKTNRFYAVTSGHVYVFKKTGGSWNNTVTADLNVGYTPEAIAFRPKHANQLATAGGNNHEVRLWDLRLPKQSLDVIRGPGSCLWAAAFSKNGKYFAWKDERSNNPTSANDRGAGPWRVFDIKHRKILVKPPKDFIPVKPLTETSDGWRLESTATAYAVRVRGPGDTNVVLNAENGLYDPREFNIPQCYTFLEPTKTKPARLVLGHTWGATIYDLREGEVKLVRSLLGHEADVMGLGASADGRLLVTAGRDQTICTWSLENWPSQAELGASFYESTKGKLIVKKVDIGSPAWEVGLMEGDEIVNLFVFKENFAFGKFDKSIVKYGISYDIVNKLRKGNAAQAVTRLSNARAKVEYIFVWKNKITDEIKAQLTTVRQRPLMRFFPTRSGTGGDWVIWRWRDFYYDTSSPVAEQLVGWHVNSADLTRKPTFHPLERYRGSDEISRDTRRAGFHRPDKVWPFMTKSFQNPEKVIFADIEPPLVTLAITQKPDAKNDLKLSITIRPRNDGKGQRLVSALLWQDDYRYPNTPQPPKGGAALVTTLTIPRSQIRHGTNVLTLQSYNASGGRGEATVRFEFDDGKVPTRTLHALCVGINDYTRVKGYKFDALHWAVNDATELSKVLEQHKGSKLFANTNVKLITNKDATARNIANTLEEMGKKVKRDDWLVLFLGGHGHAMKDTDGDSYKPGTFFYLCSDSDGSKPATLLASKTLYAILSKIPCRKLIFLDACRSGDVVSNPISDLTRDGVPLVMFSACTISQSAYEFPQKNPLHKHGFFTLSVLTSLQNAARAKGKSRQKIVTATTLARDIIKTMDDLCKNNLPPTFDPQTPVYYPRPLAPIPLLCKP